ncbi:MAG TPA: LacI family DNA-binding transcriptional regulator [Actinomycetota bacterium]|jgi:LacI family transcriptional regulator
MVRTLDELAELSGVSRATVSRVINGGPASEATRQRVLEVVERTGFRPNTAARTLAAGRGRSGVVGVVMHVEAQQLIRDPYFSGLLQGISEGISEGADGMMLWLGHRSKEETLDRILRIRTLDGVIATADHSDDPLVDGLLASSLPTVLIGHRRRDGSASYVDVDNVRAAEVVTDHLLRLGRRRIGHITGGSGTVAGADRLEGFRRAMRRAGRLADAVITDGDFSIAGGAAGASVLLADGVEAIFCANDASAAGALSAIHERGLRVPEDVAVAGYDDLEFAATLDPPLTTVRQFVVQQGEEAVATVLQLVDDPDAGPRRVILPTELVVRQSTVGRR